MLRCWFGIFAGSDQQVATSNCLISAELAGTNVKVAVGEFALLVAYKHRQSYTLD